MSQTNVKPIKKPGKKRGGELENAMHQAGAHQVSGAGSDGIPPAENGGHSHSTAAHLELGGQPNTKPAGNLRQGSHPGALREPPAVVQRVGKQHR